MTAGQAGQRDSPHGIFGAGTPLSDEVWRR